MRTLVITSRTFTEDQYNIWKKEYKRIDKESTDKEQKAKDIDGQINQLEQKMDLLGITGVEDLLQEDIRQNLEMIRNDANIKVWMLTGDKAETAEIIGISSGIKDEGADSFKLVNMKDLEKIQRKLDELDR